MESDRLLVLVRHAKAEPFAATDAERALSARGLTDAGLLGAWLGDHAPAPDVAYVSTAVRTRQTWARLAAAAAWPVEPHYDGYLYGCDEDGVLELLTAVPDDVRSVVVVGHNPTIGSLVNLLDDGDGPATGAALTGYPTGAAAVLAVPGQWSGLAPASARVLALHVARA